MAAFEGNGYSVWYKDENGVLQFLAFNLTWDEACSLCDENQDKYSVVGIDGGASFGGMSTELRKGSRFD